MFGYNFWPIYFMINMICSIIMFLFFHSALVRRTIKRAEVPVKDALKAMNISYIIYVFIGSLCLVGDIIQLFTCPKKCIWLSYIYKEKE